MAARTAVWTQATARVLRQRDGGAGHQWLELSIGRGFAVPEPGQFVQLLLGPAASGALLPRPMSVASCRRTPRGLVLGFLNPAELRGNHQRIVHSEASAEVSLHAYLTTDNA